MTKIAVPFVQKNNKLYVAASALALVTIFYNIVEGLCRPEDYFPFIMHRGLELIFIGG